MNEEIKEKAIRRAKIQISQMEDRECDKMIGYVKFCNKNASLIVAEFKCQKPGCGSEEDLTFHHLIMSKSKDFMDIERYRSQRNYWANIIILCKEHHVEYHKFFGDDPPEDMKVLGSAIILKAKKEFKISSSNDNTEREGNNK